MSKRYINTYIDPDGVKHYPTPAIDKLTEISAVDPDLDELVIHDNSQTVGQREKRVKPSKLWPMRARTILGRLKSSGGPQVIKPEQMLAAINQAGFLRALNGSTANYLRGDGTWVTPPDTNTWRPMGTGATDVFRADHALLAYNHSQAAHAPSNISNPNLLIDGNFEYWDEGTSFVGVGGTGYTTTMWFKYMNGNVERSTNVPNDKSTYSLKLYGTNDNIRVRYIVPSVTAQQIKTNCTLSFWVFRNSSAAGEPKVSINYANSKDDFSSVTYVLGEDFSTTQDAWEKKEIHLDLNQTNIENGFSILIIGTQGTTSYTEFHFSQVKLEPGTMATPFYQGEEERLRVFRYLEPFQVQSENGSRHVPFIEKRTTPAVVPSAGSAGNITTQGFELTHNTAASITGVADSRFYP